METLSIQLSNLSEVSLRCGSDNPESDSCAAQPPFGVPILIRMTGYPEVVLLKVSACGVPPRARPLKVQGKEQPIRRWHVVRHSPSTW